MKNNKGFTLVELIAVVAIITLLTVIAVPSVLNTMNTGKQKSFEVLVANIVTASKELYEEVYSNDLLGVSSSSVLYQYNATGSRLNTKIQISNNAITTNLQTLVSNGFLSGSSDGNSKTIVNPAADKKDNIGGCTIKITKSTATTTNKVTYTVTSTNQITDNNGNNVCPTTADYQKGAS